MIKTHSRAVFYTFSGMQHNMPIDKVKSHSKKRMSAKK